MKSGLKNILKGVASIGEGLASLNIFPAESTRSRIKPMTAEEALEHDQKALQGDWEAVGNDLRAAMDKIDAELAKQSIQSPRKK